MTPKDNPSAPGAAPRQAGRFALMALVLGVFLAHLLVTGAHIQSPDGELLFRTAESIALRGELSVHPLEYDEASGQLLVPPQFTFATVPGRGGDFYAQYLPLQSLLAVPLVWLGELTAPAFAGSFAPTVDTPYGSTPEGLWRRAVVIGGFNPLVNALTALILARLAGFLTLGNRRAALWTAGLWGFGTMVMVHSRTFFTEPLAGLLALVALDQLVRWFHDPLTVETSRKRLLRVVVAGAALSGAIWTRMDSPFIAAGFGLAMVAVGEFKRRRESAWGVSGGSFPFRDYAVLAAILSIAFFALVAFNAWRFDVGFVDALTGGYSDQSEGVKFSTPFLIGLHGYLTTPGRGLFFFSPALILGVLGWRCLPAGRRWTGVFIGLAWLPFTLAMCKWQNWSGGWDWGPRHIVQLHAPLALGAAFWLARPEALRPARAAITKVLMGVAVLVQLYGASQSAMAYHRDLFVTVDDGFYFPIGYNPAQTAQLQAEFVLSPPRMPARQLPFDILPAPLESSVTTWRVSPWNGYLAMWREGMCDAWLVNRVRGG
ncbi:MAG: hypothetical protein RLY93_01540 [Sumerlaeia bacterium]